MDAASRPIAAALAVLDDVELRAMTPPQPRRFATGGYVDGPGAPALSNTKGAPVRGITLIFQPQKMDAEEVRRTVIPELNKVLRTSGQRIAG